jgi:hypothetical protein
VNVTSFDALRIRRQLGREEWAAPISYGLDGWTFTNFDGKGSIIVTCAPHADGEDWVHASIAWTDRMPTYADLKLLHRAVFDGGWAYQVFAPESDHVNIHQYALHLFGRLDGKPALPDFTYGSGSI